MLKIEIDNPQIEKLLQDKSQILNISINEFVIQLIFEEVNQIDRRSIIEVDENYIEEEFKFSEELCKTKHLD